MTYRNLEPKKWNLFDIGGTYSSRVKLTLKVALVALVPLETTSDIFRVERKDDDRCKEPWENLFQLCCKFWQALGCYALQMLVKIYFFCIFSHCCNIWCKNCDKFVKKEQFWNNNSQALVNTETLVQHPLKVVKPLFWSHFLDQQAFGNKPTILFLPCFSSFLNQYLAKNMEKGYLDQGLEHPAIQQPWYFHKNYPSLHSFHSH